MKAAIEPLLHQRHSEHLEQRLMLTGTPDFTVAGTLAANAHWSGTVEVTGNLTIAGGVTVQIDPGTVVKSTQAVSITVDGTVSAVGTSTAPIIFTAWNDDSVGTSLTSTGTVTSSPGSWNQINFGGGSDASVLTDVQVRFSGNARRPGDGNHLTPAVTISNSGPTFNSVTIEKSADERRSRILHRAW